MIINEQHKVINNNQKDWDKCCNILGILSLFLVLIIMIVILIIHFYN